MKIYEYKSQFVCKCGETHPAALVFHHLNPDEKETEVGTMISTFRSIEEIEKEMNKCEVICSVCHKILHAENGELTGTVTAPP